MTEANEVGTCVESEKNILDNPNGIKLSIDGQRLYVADTDNDRIVVLNSVTLKIVGKFGEGELDGVRDIDIDPLGKLYAADTHNNRVAIYDLRHGLPRLVGELKGGISYPVSVLAHPNGDVYVSGVWSRNIVAFRDGEVVAVAEGLSSPYAIEASPDGRIWVSDTSMNRLLVMNLGLKIERILEGTVLGFQAPQDLEFIDNEYVIIAEKFSHRIGLVSLNIGSTDLIDIGRSGKSQASIRWPGGVEYRDNFLYVADSGNNRVLRCGISFK
jgi:sugar lactone lactonase YvrE